MTFKDVRVFLAGCLVGFFACRASVARHLFNFDGLPWWAKARLASYLGHLSISKTCDAIAKSERFIYATIVVKIALGLGARSLRSVDQIEDLVSQAERSYAEHLQERRS